MTSPGEPKIKLGIYKFPDAGLAWNVWYQLFLDAVKHCRVPDAQKVDLLLEYIGSRGFEDIEASLATRKRTPKSLDELKTTDEISDFYQKILQNSKKCKPEEMKCSDVGSSSELHMQQNESETIQNTTETENQNGHRKTEQSPNEATQCNLDGGSGFNKSNKSEQEQNPLYVTAKCKDENSIINAAFHWPTNLDMYIIAKHRFKDSAFSDSESVPVNFHPSPRETLRKLMKIASSGYVGLVRLSQERDNKFLILCYKDDAFRGYIPNNQNGFIERLEGLKDNSERNLQSAEQNTTDEPCRKKPKLSSQLQIQEAHCSYTVESNNQMMDNSTSSNNSHSDNESIAVMNNSPDRIYSLGYKSIGHVIIINISQFKKTKIKERKGSEKDVEELSNVFGKLGFNVAEPLINKSHAKIIKCLNDFRKNETLLKEISSLFVILMSHGNKNDEVMAFDEEMDIYKDIVNLFSSDQCPDLAGKPKVFIIQACRGDDMDQKKVSKKKQKGAKKRFGCTVQHTVEYVPILPLEDIPNFTDILIATSAYKNHAAYLNPMEGSDYIQELCKLLNSTDLYKEHLVDILTTLNAQIAQKLVDVIFEEKGKTKLINDVRMTSTFYSMLTKKFYFKAKKTDHYSEEDLDELTYTIAKNKIKES